MHHTEHLAWACMPEYSGYCTCLGSVLLKSGAGMAETEQPVSAEIDFDGDSLLHTIYLLQGIALHSTGSESGPTHAMSKSIGWLVLLHFKCHYRVEAKARQHISSTSLPQDPPTY